MQENASKDRRVQIQEPELRTQEPEPGARSLSRVAPDFSRLLLSWASGYYVFSAQSADDLYSHSEREFWGVGVSQSWKPRFGRSLTLPYLCALHSLNWPPQASAFRTSGSVPADPSFAFLVAMNFAYSSTKILPGGRKSNSPGWSRKNSR
jgi:hypothetical protein